MIQALQLFNIRGLSGEWTFSKVTRISGPNGSGKSTIAMAIETALRGDHPSFPANQWQSYMRSAKEWKIALQIDGCQREFTPGIKALTPSPLGEKLALRFQWQAATGPEKTRLLAKSRVARGGVNYETLAWERDAAQKALCDARASATAAKQSLQDLITQTRPSDQAEVTDEMIQRAKVAADEAAGASVKAREAAEEAHAIAVASKRDDGLATLDESIADLEALADGHWRLAIQAKDCKALQCPVCGASPWTPIDRAEHAEDLEIAKHEKQRAMAEAREWAAKNTQRKRAPEELATEEAASMTLAKWRALKSVRATQDKAQALASMVEPARERLATLEAEAVTATEKAKAAQTAFEDGAAAVWQGLTALAESWLKIVTGKEYDVVERSGRLAIVIGGQALPEIAMSGGERVAIEIALAEHFHPELLILDEAGRLSSQSLKAALKAASDVFGQIIYCVPSSTPPRKTLLVEDVS